MSWLTISANFPTGIAQYLNLSFPEQYIEYSFRRTPATLLVYAGGDIFT